MNIDVNGSLPSRCKNAAGIPVVNLNSSDWTRNFGAGTNTCPARVRERILRDVGNSVIRQGDRTRGYELLFVVLYIEMLLALLPFCIAKTLTPA